MKHVKSKAFVRTTIDIPTPLYKELRQRAAREGSSIRKLVLRGVEVAMQPAVTQPKRRIQSAIVKSKHPGTLKLTNDQIYELGFP